MKRDFNGIYHQFKLKENIEHFAQWIRLEYSFSSNNLIYANLVEIWLSLGKVSISDKFIPRLALNFCSSSDFLFGSFFFSNIKVSIVQLSMSRFTRFRLYHIP